MLFVVATAARGGVRAGFEAVRGIQSAMIVHVAAAALGLSALFAASHLAFDVLRVAGAGYLIWLGIAALRSGARGRHAEPAAGSDAFRRGFLTNVTNPKVIVFFAAFLPQFVTAGGAPVALQILVLGATFAALGFVCDVAYAIGAGVLSRRLLRSPRVMRAVDAAAGAVMIALGVDVLAERQAA
ncbi:RhtB family transporter [Vulcanimicrobium alpinum]|uniref:RhtB family transporter n=2 Tax=Vulcanimicrobium alpinum TaxID=3016050 RepID=A0AAN1XV67_UNVUL|nr:RhtB family transporter [Vulcanimicrobium alpinum]